MVWSLLRCSRSKQVIIGCIIIVLVTTLLAHSYMNDSDTARRQIKQVKPRPMLPPVQNVAHLIDRLRQRQKWTTRNAQSTVARTTELQFTTTELKTTQWATTRVGSTTTGVVTTTEQDETDRPPSIGSVVVATNETPMRGSTVRRSTTRYSRRRTTRKRRKLSEIQLRSKIIRNFIKAEIDPEDKRIMLDLLDTLWKVKKENNFTMFLYGGTLLGSWRHHGFIPYDDDIDIASPKAIFTPLLKALNRVGPKYKAVRAGPRIKFFSNESHHKTVFSWKWPYADLQFYDEDEDNIWDMAGEFKDWKYPKKYVFPLRFRPYEGKWYETPRSPEEFMKVYYNDLSSCETGWYSHKGEAGQKVNKIQCKYLQGLYPFVMERKTVDGKTVEVLKQGSKVVKEVTIPS